MNRVNVPKEVRDKVETRLRECIKLAEGHFNETFDFPTIRYRLRGTTGGTANVRDWIVNFNSVLLMENVDKFITRTVAHEMAHLVDYKMHPDNFRPRYGRKRSTHGYTWKAIMMLFGAPPTRCHKYDTTNSKVHSRRTVKHVWVCGCGKAEMKIGAKRHKKQLVLGTRGYYVRGHTARRCGAYVYQGREGDAAPKMLRAADAAGSKGTSKRPAPRHKITKLTICRDAYRATATRATNINRFIALGCTPAGAATYYAKIKKELA